MIYQICDVIRYEYIRQGDFLVYLLNQTRQVTKLGYLIDIIKGSNFKELVEQFGGLGLRSRSFSI